MKRHNVWLFSVPYKDDTAAQAGHLMPAGKLPVHERRCACIDGQDSTLWGESWTPQICRSIMWVSGQYTMSSVRTALLFTSTLCCRKAAQSTMQRALQGAEGCQAHSQAAAARATFVLPCPMMHCNDHIVIVGAGAQCAAGRSKGPLLHAPVLAQTSIPILSL